MQKKEQVPYNKHTVTFFLKIWPCPSSLKGHHQSLHVGGFVYFLHRKKSNDWGYLLQFRSSWKGGMGMGRMWTWMTMVLLYKTGHYSAYVHVFHRFLVRWLMDHVDDPGWNWIKVGRNLRIKMQFSKLHFGTGSFDPWGSKVKSFF